MTSRLDIKITFRCNNMCRFCAQGHKRDMYPDKSVGAVESCIVRAYASLRKRLSDLKDE